MMTIEIGQKVKTIFGKIETVSYIEESRIFTEESGHNSWFHPSKVLPVYWSENLKKFVTIPE